MKSRHLAWLGLFGGWLLMVLLIDPRGEFPLNDDWAYARAVKTLHDTGRLELPTTWASMTMFAHVLWGWAVTLPFGFSFLILRLANLIPAAAGIIGIYVLLRDCGMPRTTSILGAAASGLNPLYVQLTVSFMTDLSFFATLIWSSILLLRFLRTSSRWSFVLGALLALLAVMIRQHGVFIGLAWAVVWLWRTRPHDTPGYAVAGTPLILQGSYLWIHHVFIGPIMGSQGVLSEIWWWSNLLSTSGITGVAGEALWRATQVAVYAGLLTLPLILTALAAKTGRINWKGLGIALAAGVAAALLVAVSGRTFQPDVSNLVYDFGIGTPTLRDIYILRLPNLQTAPLAFWVIVTVAGIFGAVVLLSRWLRFAGGLRRMSNAHASDSILFFSIISLGGLVLLPLLPFFDRYMILHLPLLILLSVPRSRAPSSLQWRMSPALIYLLAVAAFSTAGVRDYFAWNRARWSALSWLTEVKGVDPHEIDGGFEFNGWNTYNPGYRETKEKSWWWVTGDKYLVTFGPVSEFEAIRALPYRTWLPPGERSILVLERTDRAQARVGSK